MPAALPVDWKGLRLMYVHGSTLEEIADSAGISLGTVCARSAREGWKRELVAAQDAKKSRSVSVAVQSGRMQEHAISAVDTVEAALKDDARATRVGLTRYAKRMAEQANTEGTLEEAPLYKAIADIHAKMHPEAAPSGSVNLSFFQIRHEHVQDTEERPVIDV